VVNLIGAGWSI